MIPSLIKIQRITLRRAELHTRMPFRYGIATMLELPHVFVIVDAEIDGKTSRGIAADHLPPKWFTKDPDRALADEIVEMATVIKQAATFAQGIEAETPFAFWEKLYSAQDAWAAEQGYPPLLAHFGTSLVERAVLEAYARAKRCPLHALLRGDRLGVDLGRIHAELTGTRTSQWLPAQPLPEVHCRHTIGLSDPLVDGDIPEGEVLRDGLPQSLTACIAHYGLTQFKIKFTSDRKTSLPRLVRIAEVLMRETGGHFSASLDGNESFYDVADFRAFIEEAQPLLKPIFDRLLFIEQPLHRSVALNDAVAATLPTWTDRPPIIIDESDGELGSLPRALECGYAGTSHKNSKGIFKGIANACLLAKLRAEGRTTLMSAEDLTTIGPVSLLQDLALQAMLGNASVERNGHHYFRGLSFWPAALQKVIREQHPDLYAEKDGLTALRVEHGSINLGTVNAAPFGVAPLLDDELAGLPEL